MNKSIILIYATDPWHSRTSQELIGVATTEKHRDRLVSEFLRDGDGVKLSARERDKAVEEVRQDGQTQSLSEYCDFEILTETVTLNELTC